MSWPSRSEWQKWNSARKWSLIRNFSFRTNQSSSKSCKSSKQFEFEMRPMQQFMRNVVCQLATFHLSFRKLSCIVILIIIITFITLYLGANSHGKAAEPSAGRARRLECLEGISRFHLSQWSLSAAGGQPIICPCKKPPADGLNEAARVCWALFGARNSSRGPSRRAGVAGR